MNCGCVDTYFDTCTYCARNICTECKLDCIVCGYVVCESCTSKCYICSEIVCMTCVKRIELVKMSYSDIPHGMNHKGKNVCRTCRETLDLYVRCVMRRNLHEILDNKCIICETNISRMCVKKCYFCNKKSCDDCNYPVIIDKLSYIYATQSFVNPDVKIRTVCKDCKFILDVHDADLNERRLRHTCVRSSECAF